MEGNEIDKIINSAEVRIAKILQELEIQTDCVVEGVFVDDCEVTTMDSPRPQLVRKTTIELRRQPGTRWQVYDTSTLQ